MKLTSSFSACLFVAVGIVGSTATLAQTHRSPATSTEHEAVERLRREQGIRAAAAAYGKYTGEDEGEGNLVARDVTTLAWWSDIVAVVEPEGATSRISRDGRGIVTEYAARIVQIWKGPKDIASGARMALSMPGGMYVFDDGSTAATWVRGIRAMPTVGKRYLLFGQTTTEPGAEAASGKGAAGPRLTPALGSQGLFELRAQDETVEIAACGAAMAPAAIELSRVTTLRELETALRAAIVEADRQRPRNADHRD